jgi:hypothetical protein
MDGSEEYTQSINHAIDAANEWAQKLQRLALIAGVVLGSAAVALALVVIFGFGGMVAQRVRDRYRGLVEVRQNRPPEPFRRIRALAEAG